MLFRSPEISADVATETLGSEFSFDQRLLDNIFEELAPPEPLVPARSLRSWRSTTGKTCFHSCAGKNFAGGGSCMA